MCVCVCVLVCVCACVSPLHSYPNSLSQPVHIDDVRQHCCPSMRVSQIVQCIKLGEQPATKQVVQTEGGHKEGSKEDNEQELTVVGEGKGRGEGRGGVRGVDYR